MQRFNHPSTDVLLTQSITMLRLNLFDKFSFFDKLVGTTCTRSIISKPFKSKVMDTNPVTDTLPMVIHATVAYQ